MPDQWKKLVQPPTRRVHWAHSNPASSERVFELGKDRFDLTGGIDLRGLLMGAGALKGDPELFGLAREARVAAVGTLTGTLIIN